MDTPRKRRSSLTPSEIYFKTRPGNTPRLRAGLRSGGSSCCAAKTLARSWTSATTSSPSKSPDFIEVYFATADMALGKDDYALAAETLRKAPKAAAFDPRFHYLMARALANDDRQGTAKALAEALKINPRHVDTLLLVADEMIDGERYSEAERVLEQVFLVNSREPRAFAYKAVLAHLRNDPAGEEVCAYEGA